MLKFLEGNFDCRLWPKEAVKRKSLNSNEHNCDVCAATRGI